MKHISIQPGQKALTPETPQTELEAAREEGLQRLKAAIDAIEDTVA